ncbi:hypothetical protein [Desulfitibacter alkalitolerans]|uniref:hypothetical protein n=1 Tax=Desulfitibacter alkalitolerans TaxID=264641 RepID=UPI000483BD0F|nr:hypothetical protein [Desulfitibacter alkalitolerans]
MDLIISILITLAIGIIPIKKIFTRVFFSHRDLFMDYYDLKKCYGVWGHVSYFLPLLDFLKAPALYYYLNLLDLHGNTLLIIILIALWLANPLSDLFYGRGMSIFLGIFLVVNMEIFKIIFLIYMSLLLLSRYQSAASFLTGAAAVPIVIYSKSYTLIELFLVAVFSCIVVYHYKGSFYQILNKRFFHLSS